MSAPEIIGWRRRDDFDPLSSAPQSWLVPAVIDGYEITLETYALGPSVDDYARWLDKHVAWWKIDVGLGDGLRIVSIVITDDAPEWHFFKGPSILQALEKTVETLHEHL